ncbi:H-NS histone family protein [Jhaorihella thermophila]|uniref:DNA-binding protein H-NS n=1 Tax=Jhaorihella thermophila TaxID=488547 RepID=A0A1H5SM36_9RHOB|nr:H-NS histone family protein [Jhaorihella thermophila]SEF51575.1 DNA-binding protein H-NS [Jhaorihella thermophila]
MAINLEQMSRKELLALQRDLEKALAAAERREREAARKEAEAAAAKYGFSLDEITGGGKPKSSGAKIKYRNPDNPAQTWSGRGRKPAWVHEALARGLDITDLEA